MKLNTEAEFSNMNVRAERAGEDVGEGAVDMTFACSLNIEQVAQMFGDQKWMKTFLESIYTGDNPIPNLQRCNWNREINGVQTHIDPEFMEPLELEKTTLRKITLAPDNGRLISVKFQIQAHPTGEQVGQLYEIQGRDVQLSLNGSQTDLFDAAGGESDDPDGEAADEQQANETEAALE